MGLDMYAARKLYVKKWEHESKDECYSVTVTRGGKAVRGLKPENISTIEEEVMYWRKANHIHRWFVDYVQNGSDDGAEYYVSWEQLETLADICDKVIEASELTKGKINGGTVYSKKHPNGVIQWQDGQVIKDSSVARALLPTMDGFFFGTYEYDSFYLSEVIDTRNWARRMLKDHRDGVPGSIYYSSSW